MTQEDWKNASDEERNDEIERCKDPVYFYNNYWRMVGMPEYSKEYFERMQQEAIQQRMRVNPRRFQNPSTIKESFNRYLPDFLKEQK
jgi:hypothetical protein